MTRDEQRNECIEVMDRAFMSVAWRHICPDVFEQRRIKKGIAAAFDSLHGIARVNPIEATESIIKAAYHPNGELDDVPMATIEECWEEMSAAGDLTKPPE